MKNKLKLDQGVLSEIYCISRPPRIFFMTSSLRNTCYYMKLIPTSYTPCVRVTQIYYYNYLRKMQKVSLVR